MTKQQILALVAVLAVVAVVIVVKATGDSNGAAAPAEQLAATDAGALDTERPPTDEQGTEATETATEDTATAESPDSEAAAGLPTLLELGSVGCRPCRYMEPIIDALAEQLAGKVVVEFHDVAKKPEMAQKYEIMTIPTQVFLDADGNELFRHIGVFEKEEILAKLKELGMLKE